MIKIESDEVNKNFKKVVDLLYYLKNNKIVYTLHIEVKEYDV
jgi:hypothetical protein